MSAGQGVGVDGYEEVGLGAVGYVGSFVQGDEYIGLAGVDHLDVRAVALHVTAKGECHVEVYVLFFRCGTECAGVVSAVSGVDDEGELAVRCSLHGEGERE